MPGVGLEAVVPFAVETFGRLGPSALRLLHAARQRAAERNDSFRSWAGLALHQRWLAQLSCSLARALQTVAYAMLGESAAVTNDAGEPLLPLL